MKPTVLQLGPLLPLVEKGLAASCVHLNLGNAPDAARFLAENGASIQAVASSGRNGVNAALIDALPGLRLISHFGVGYDNVDVAHAKAKGVTVSNTPDVLTDCVADLAIALLIDVARGISAGDRYVRAGRWPGGPMPLATKASGKRLGIVGLGRIGLAIAARAEGFDMEIRYHNRRQIPDSPYAFEHSLADLARWCDFLMVATSGGEATRGLVSAAVIEALGQEGFLVNIARGSVVDEPALLAALSERRIAGAALDVFADEPRVPEAFFTLDNVVLTPHIASATTDTRAAMGQLVLDNLESFFTDGRALTPV
ncbi:MAG: 2-hydroxyacid dehydrogenase [Betaproteobacteria bacterium]|nr:2-hydroxyacid dehydrogenase [Betaproteobacteria bacterium]